MTTPQDARQAPGRVAADREGSEAGHVYLDAETGVPLWIAVVSGMFGARESSAPTPGSGAARGQVSRR